LKKQYAGLSVQDVRELRQLREENSRLKRIVADLTLDRQILPARMGVEGRKWVPQKKATGWKGKFPSPRRCCGTCTCEKHPTRSNFHKQLQYSPQLEISSEVKAQTCDAGLSSLRAVNQRISEGLIAEIRTHVALRYF
jgi:hypothetical protein